VNARVLYRVVLLAGALIVTGLLVEQLVTLLAAAVVVLIISLPLSAAAAKAERLGLPRAVGAITALVAVLAVGAAVALLLAPEFIGEARQFGARLPTIIAGAEHLAHVLTGVSGRKLNADVSRFAQSYTQHPERLLGPLTAIGLDLLGLVVAILVMLVAAIYIAINPDALRSGLLRLIPADRRSQAERIITRVSAAWMGWIVAIGIDMIVLGGLLYLGMTAVGLDFALGFAVFSALLTVIPNWGSVISAVPPILLGLSESPTRALLVLGVYLFVNQIEGNLILPLVMARNVDLHPALVAIGLLVMAQLFGIIGVLIAIPLLSLTIILVEELWIAPQETAALTQITQPRSP
jgi:predicted PurR-regulated permease PerM